MVPQNVIWPTFSPYPTISGGDFLPIVPGGREERQRCKFAIFIRPKSDHCLALSVTVKGRGKKTISIFRN